MTFVSRLNRFPVNGMKKVKNKMDIEKIMKSPCRIIDILPKRVPDNRSVSYSMVEQYYLSEQRLTEIRMKQADIIVRLSSYYYIQFSDNHGESFSDAAVPDIIERQILNCVGTASLYIGIKSPECLITLDGCDTYMTVYSSDAEFTEILGQLAGSVGLFIWEA